MSTTLRVPPYEYHPMSTTLRGPAYEHHATSTRLRAPRYEDHATSTTLRVPRCARLHAVHAGVVCVWAVVARVEGAAGVAGALRWRWRGRGASRRKCQKIAKTRQIVYNLKLKRRVPRRRGWIIYTKPCTKKYHCLAKYLVFAMYARAKVDRQGVWMVDAFFAGTR